MIYFLLFVAAVVVLWAGYTAAVLVWWWAQSRAQNRKFNRVRGRALVAGLVRSGGVR